MRYICVNWRQSNPKYPTILYSELDDANWEIRKVEVFANGHCGYASENESGGDTRLGIEPLPALTEIASDPEFDLKEITHDAFEQVWAKRQGG